MSNLQLNDDRLLRRHRLHVGLYARVAKNLNLTSSYVSLVAAGKRHNDRIKRAIVSELRRIDQIRNSP
jgi:hypothetical protein